MKYCVWQFGNIWHIQNLNIFNSFFNHFDLLSSDLTCNPKLSFEFIIMKNAMHGCFRWKIVMYKDVLTSLYYLLGTSITGIYVSFAKIWTPALPLAAIQNFWKFLQVDNIFIYNPKTRNFGLSLNRLWMLVVGQNWTLLFVNLFQTINSVS